MFILLSIAVAFILGGVWGWQAGYDEAREDNFGKQGSARY